MAAQASGLREGGQHTGLTVSHTGGLQTWLFSPGNKNCLEATA